MANVIVVGAGIGGVPAAFELRKKLDKQHTVTLVGASPYFEFTPSNPWVAVGWRRIEQTRVALQEPLQDKRPPGGGASDLECDLSRRLRRYRRCVRRLAGDSAAQCHVGGDG